MESSKGKSGNTCKYFKCGKSRKTNPEISTHRFPTNLERCQKWILNSGNPELRDIFENDPKELRKMFICSLHFPPEAYTKSGNLIKTAVPIKFEDNNLVFKRNIQMPAQPFPQSIETELSPISSVNYREPGGSGVQDSVRLNCSLQAIASSGQRNTPRNATPVKSSLPLSSSTTPPLKVLTPQKSYEITPSRKRSRDVASDTYFVDKPDSDYCRTPATPITPRTSRFVRESTYLPEDGNPGKCRRAPAPDDTPRKKKLKETVKNLQRNIKNKNLSISRLKSNKKSWSQKILDKYLSPLSKNSRTLVLMQLKGNNKKWSKKEKKFAMSIYYKSPTTYSFLRRNGIILPGMSTVRRWFNSIGFSPGINKKYCEYLKLKASTMTSMQKACVIMFDEMAIMKNIDYNRSWDLIEGFEDLGELGRTNRFGTSSFVIMIRGLYHQWKIPFSYYIAGKGGVKEHHLKEIIEKTVSKVAELGFCPKAVVCDQGGQNQKVEPLFEQTEDGFYLISGFELVWIFDVPHLMKSLRNNLLNGDLLVGDNKVVSFRDIVAAYHIDSQSNTSRGLLKITPVHLNPNKFMRMNCRLALQIFSHAVGTVIETLIETGQLQSSTAPNTAEFLLFMNDLFDCLNSRQLYNKNPNKNALSEDNIHQFDIINKALQLFKKLKKVNWHADNKNEVKNEKEREKNEEDKKEYEMAGRKKENKSNKTNNKKGEQENEEKIKTDKKYTLTRPPCFDGFVTSLTSILKLYKRESEIEEYKEEIPPSTPYYLITSRLNQDPLENFFSIVRQRNGYNKNPTTKHFRCSFAHITNFSFHKYTEVGNCDADEDFFLDLNFEQKQETIEKVEKNEIMKKMASLEIQKEKSSNNDVEVMEIEENQNLMTNSYENDNEKEQAEINENGEIDGINVGGDRGEINADDETDDVINDCDWEHWVDDFFCDSAENMAAEGDLIICRPLVNHEEGPAKIVSSASLESCANVFFSGRIVRWLKKKYKCDRCVKLLDGVKAESQVPDEDSILIKKRRYKNITDPKKGLETPTPLLVSVLILTLNILFKKFKSHPEKKDFIKFTVVRAKEEIATKFPEFLEDCVDHKEEILKYIIRTKIFKTCKSISQGFYKKTDNNPKILPKLRILQESRGN